MPITQKQYDVLKKYLTDKAIESIPEGCHSTLISLIFTITDTKSKTLVLPFIEYSVPEAVKLLGINPKDIEDDMMNHRSKYGVSDIGVCTVIAVLVEPTTGFKVSVVQESIPQPLSDPKLKFHRISQEHNKIHTIEVLVRLSIYSIVEYMNYLKSANFDKLNG